MILYNNGNGHSAAAQAVNSWSLASEDQKYQHLGDVPHPDNLRISYGAVLASLLKMSFYSNAMWRRSNDNIIDITKSWIRDTNDTVAPEDVFMVIQWEGTDRMYEWEDIVEFHIDLTALGYQHLFFADGGEFSLIHDAHRYDFGPNFVDPYLAEGSYEGWLQASGYQPVITSNRYFGPDAHAAWARHLVQHIIKNKMI